MDGLFNVDISRYQDILMAEKLKAERKKKEIVEGSPLKK